MLKIIMFLVRIFTVDFYMSAPIEGLDSLYSDFRGSSINNVPVIRVFGSSETGSKTCLHVHGVFPYLYIPYDGTEDASSLMYQIANKLDQAINISLGHASSTTQHIYKIVLVSGIPFYGYHYREHQFFKIFFYNPLIVKKACSLLQNGNIFGKIYQLHEAHIPFILQFMIDYNLHGMNFISLSQVFYRVSDELSEADIPSQFILPVTVIKKTTSRVEIDTLAEYIVNRIEVAAGKITKNPGIAALWEDEKQRRRNKDETSQISPCMTQNRIDVPPTVSHTLYKHALRDRLVAGSINEQEADANSSVYAAETPKLHNLISASFVQSHSLTNESSLSFSSSRNSADANCSFLNNSCLDISSFNDTQANDLLQVLQDLVVAGSDKIEEDSILSQTIKVQEESDEENETDMTMPFVTTPMKNSFDNIPVENTSQNADDMVASNIKDSSDLDNPLEIADSLSYNKDKTEVSEILKDESTVCVENSIAHSQQIVSILEQVKRKLSFTEMRRRTKGEHAKNIKVECKDPAETLLPTKHTHHNTNLSKAEEYDRTSNFICLEGSSKETHVFSDDSDNSLIKLSAASVYQKPSSLSNDSKVTNSPLSLNSNESTLKTQLTVDKNKKTVTQPDNDEVLMVSSNISSSNEKPKINFSQNVSMLQATVLNNGEISLSAFEYYSIMPKFHPPSREEIVNTLEEYNIPSVVYQKPFYSESEDVSGEVQIGHKRLKIGTLYSDLMEFESSVVDHTLQQLIYSQLQTMYPQEQVSNKSFSMKLSFCEETECIVTPSVLPPTRLDILLWIKAKNEKVKPAVKKEKRKIPVPCSPNELHSDESLISISPFSPINEKPEVSENDSLQQTPVLKSKSKVLKKKRSKISARLKARNLRKYLDANASESESLLKKTLLQSQLMINFISPTQNGDSSHITGASPDNTHGFMMSLENLQKARAVTEHQYLTTLVMELHTKTRLELNPNPELDPIRAIFYSVLNDAPESTSSIVGAIVLIIEECDSFQDSLLSCSGNCKITFVETEINLINEFIEVTKQWDPDIIGGYEIQLLSWGYLLERGQVLGMNLHPQFARAESKFNTFDDDPNTELKITGRIVLDIWRLMRHEIALQSYTFENIVYHILHKRLPLYSFKDLSFWWEHCKPLHRYKTFNFYFSRVTDILELFDRLDLIGRTSELARLFGIQFYEVLSRGSQFRVESMMLRLAKPLNYIPVSPSVQQRAKMRAPEFLALILEPDSQFYVDPVIVLDFQSLYPSMIIAYNYCFSTCLGRVELLGQNNPFEFGATQLKVNPKLVDKLLRQDLLVFSPCGVAFVKPKVREGILPRMLSEILDTRLMVKKSMKQNADDKLLQRILHSRQLGLKLIANVTYGYSAANFSGRMPSVELADSVVSKGRETLMRAIKLIENTPQWGAKVVYGDTDSIFVLVPGKSKEAAFKIGEEIAEQVTNDNPSPVKLKLEKIFLPCILQTKKRYVGDMYESVNQTEPEFCAKGIETVRRDGCPAVSKMLEKSLKILFESRDVSLVRKYVVRQFSKLLSGRASLQDLIFAKEYRGASNYRPGACVPVLELTRKWLAVDKRSEPRCAERVPYVIVNGPPGLPLIKLVRSPRDLLTDTNLRPNIIYYITRVIIPPLNRCFTLIGADLNKWFNSMPRKQMQICRVSPDSKGRKTAISHYFISTDCVICGQQTQDGVCLNCRSSQQEAFVIFNTKVRLWNRAHQEANLICQSCNGQPDNRQCVSLDCPVMYYIKKTHQDVQQIPYLQQVVSTAFDLDF